MINKLCEGLAWRYGLLAVVIYFLYITSSLIPGWRAEPVLSDDALTYEDNARQLLRSQHFTRELHPPYLWEPYRTPGYPILIALGLLVSGSVNVTLFLAALGGGVAAFAAVFFCSTLGGRKLEQHISGLLVMLMPNALGLSAQLLTDGIVGFLFLVWVYCCWKGLRQNDNRFYILSIFVMLLLQLLKPTFFAGGLLVIWAFAALLGKQMINVKTQLAASLLILMIFPLTTTLFIHNDHGVWASNLKGVEAIRDYLQVEYLSDITGRDFPEISQEISVQDRHAADEMTSPVSFDGRLYLVRQAEVKKFLHKNSLGALAILGKQILKQFAAPQEFAYQVLWGQLPKWGRAMGSVLTLVLWIMTGIGCWRLIRSGDWRTPLFFLGIIIFFLIAGSISQRVGARLRFPADMAGTPLMALGIGWVIQHVCR
jgi:4-amino-4-deoxy-L-arabinose transferase-like glycosyltransferase